MANSVDPDQTAPLGAVWPGSALFAQTYLSENLGSLWYYAVVSLEEAERKFKTLIRLLLNMCLFCLLRLVCSNTHKWS